MFLLHGALPTLLTIFAVGGVFMLIRFVFVLVRIALLALVWAAAAVVIFPMVFVPVLAFKLARDACWRRRYQAIGQTYIRR
jgi:hypothetical protein